MAARKSIICFGLLLMLLPICQLKIVWAYEWGNMQRSFDLHVLSLNVPRDLQGRRAVCRLEFLDGVCLIPMIATFSFGTISKTKLSLYYCSSRVYSRQEHRSDLTYFLLSLLSFLPLLSRFSLPYTHICLTLPILNIQPKPRIENQSGSL